MRQRPEHEKGYCVRLFKKELSIFERLMKVLRADLHTMHQSTVTSSLTLGKIHGKIVAYTWKQFQALSKGPALTIIDERADELLESYTKMSFNRISKMLLASRTGRRPSIITTEEVL